MNEAACSWRVMTGRIRPESSRASISPAAVSPAPPNAASTPADSRLRTRDLYTRTDGTPYTDPEHAPPEQRRRRDGAPDGRTGRPAPWIGRATVATSRRRPPDGSCAQVRAGARTLGTEASTVSRGQRARPGSALSTAVHAISSLPQKGGRMVTGSTWELTPPNTFR